MSDTMPSDITSMPSMIFLSPIAFYLRKIIFRTVSSGSECLNMLLIVRKEEKIIRCKVGVSRY